MYGHSNYCTYILGVRLHSTLKKNPSNVNLTCLTHFILSFSLINYNNIKFMTSIKELKYDRYSWFYICKLEQTLSLGVGIDNYHKNKQALVHHKPFIMV